MTQQTPKKGKANWLQSTQEFIKEWPEVFEGLSFSYMPVKYVEYCNIQMVNGVTVHIDVATDLLTKDPDTIAETITEYVETNRNRIDSVEIKFDTARIKSDIIDKTDLLLGKAFSK